MREGGGGEHFGRPGDPDTAVGLYLEAGTAARRHQQQGGQLGLPGVPYQRGQPGGSDARKFRAHGPRARYFQARLFFSSTPFSVKVSVSLRPK